MLFYFINPAQWKSYSNKKQIIQEIVIDDAVTQVGSVSNWVSFFT